MRPVTTMPPAATPPVDDEAAIGVAAPGAVTSLDARDGGVPGLSPASVAPSSTAPEMEGVAREAGGAAPQPASIPSSMPPALDDDPPRMSETSLITQVRGFAPVRDGRSLRQWAERRIGTMLGPYRLVALIGMGGMGCVYRAEHTLLGRTVAIKVLTPRSAGYDPGVGRFFQEARIVNRVRHPRIVDVTDLVELGDGTCFIVMELLAGSSLAEVLRAGPIAEARALEIVDQVCDALEAVHAIDVVHRDLKPQNMFVCADGGIKLLDFGIAKLSDGGDTGSPVETAPGAMIGTPMYMSPEQVEGGDVDGRSDIYSLGVVLYELLFGGPPFTGRNARECAYQHLNEAPKLESKPGRPPVRPALARIVERCLLKRPADRYQTAAELRADLRGALDPSSDSMLSSQTLVASTAVRASTVPAVGVRTWLPAALTTALVAAITAVAATRLMPRSSTLPAISVPAAIEPPATTPIGGPPPVTSGVAPLDQGPSRTDIGAPPGDAPSSPPPRRRNGRRVARDRVPPASAQSGTPPAESAEQPPPMPPPTPPSARPIVPAAGATIDPFQ